ncbi:HEAT repeat domain-containing protein [Fontisphaera persica]|uniref:HEAT repeat domain-containing protein n=1 Tax=Fontisphaera persica TaxID=2974023 RepID=UPI0024BFAC82|nr:HEAT repeat domain-containing protein [Fontisphaera persica]WCJ59172.1 HEAT repeat domain-containing protein [Fontisphaera persica]
MRPTVALLTALAAALFVLPLTSRAATEAELLGVLKSDADRAAKAAACRQLAILGGASAVPVLAELLTNEELSHMARYALEPNPSPAVNPALREALGKTSGRLKVGIISSLGMRRDAQAVSALSALLTDADADVAQAAARALGQIATPNAVSALEKAVGQTAPANQVAFCEGLFRAAESLAASRKTAEALRVYQQLRALPAAPHQVRAGALRGLILNSPAKAAVNLVLEGVRSEDYILTAAAAGAAMEVKNAELSKVLASELPKLNADKQILLIQVLGKRGDAAAYPALFELARSGQGQVRLAAIRALPEIGKPGAVPVLAGLINDADKAVSAAAVDALAGFPGKEADAAVMKLLEAPEPAQRVRAIDLAARRRMTQTIPLLAKAASDTAPEVRVAALRRLGELGGPAEVKTMLDLVLKHTGAQELGALEQGLIAICNATGKPDESAEKVAAILPQAQGAQKSTLLRVLGGIGGARALQAVRSVVGDANPDVHADAIRTLGEWRTPDVADVLLELARTSQRMTDKVLCLRNYLKIADGVQGGQKIAMCKAAEPLITRDEERRVLLGVLGKATLEALPVMLPYLEQDGTREEACLAVVNLAERTMKGVRTNNPGAAARLKEPLARVVALTQNAAVKKRAQDLLNSMGQ